MQLILLFRVWQLHFCSIKNMNSKTFHQNCLINQNGSYLNKHFQISWRCNDWYYSMSCREVIVSNKLTRPIVLISIFKKTVTIIFGIDKQLATVTYVVHLDMNILINNKYNGWSNWFMTVIAFYRDIMKPLFFILLLKDSSRFVFMMLDTY